jgi:hypothetical protein
MLLHFENNFYDVSVPIVNYLYTKNYCVFHMSIDIFMIHKESVFYTPKK